MSRVGGVVKMRYVDEPMHFISSVVLVTAYDSGQEDEQWRTPCVHSLLFLFRFFADTSPSSPVLQDLPPSLSRTSRRNPYRAKRKRTAVKRPYEFVSLRVRSLGGRGGNAPREFARAYPERSIPKCRTKLSRGFPYPLPLCRSERGA